MTEENSEIEWNISQSNPRVINLPCYFNTSLQFHRHVDIDHRIWIIDTRSGWLVYRNWLRMKGMCYCNSCSIDKKAPYDSNSHEFNSSTHAFFFFNPSIVFSHVHMFIINIFIQFPIEFPIEHRIQCRKWVKKWWNLSQVEGSSLDALSRIERELKISGMATFGGASNGNRIVHIPYTSLYIQSKALT